MFDTLFYKPILNILILIYNGPAARDLGLAIILVTILVRTVLYPFYHKMTHQQAIMNKIKPELNRITKEHKDDKTKQGLMLSELYKKNKVNPFFPILFIIIQIPIMFALYKALNTGIGEKEFSGLLYSFVHYPENIKLVAFGFLNLKARSIVLVVSTAIAQFYQSKISTPIVAEVKEGEPNMMPSGNMMAAMMTGITLMVLWTLPAAIGIYWLTSTIFSVGQQLICNRQIKNAELKGDN